MTTVDSLRLLEGLCISEAGLQEDLLDHTRLYPLNARADLYALMSEEDRSRRQRAVALQYLIAPLYRFWEHGFVEFSDIQRVVEHNERNRDKFWSTGLTTQVSQMYWRMGPPESGFLLGVQDNGIPANWARLDSVSSRLVRFSGGDLDGVEATLGDLARQSSRLIPKNHPVYSQAEVYVPDRVESLNGEDPEDDPFALPDANPEYVLVMQPA